MGGDSGKEVNAVLDFLEVMAILGKKGVKPWECVGISDFLHRG